MSLLIGRLIQQNAVLQLLAWNTKEGEFLLNGAVIGHSDDMPANVNNIVRCSANNNSNSNSNSNNTITNSMEKVVYTGYNSINGSLQSTVTPVSNADLPSLVPGFKFLGSPCNPCSALDSPQQSYTCPCALNTGNGYDVSPVWNKLWTSSVGASNDGSSTSTGSINDGSNDTTITNASTFDSSSNILDPTKFPLLSQLKDEIMGAAQALGDTYQIVKRTKLTDVSKTNVGVSNTSKDTVGLYGITQSSMAEEAGGIVPRNMN